MPGIHVNLISGIVPWGFGGGGGAVQDRGGGGGVEILLCPIRMAPPPPPPPLVDSSVSDTYGIQHQCSHTLNELLTMKLSRCSLQACMPVHIHRRFNDSYLIQYHTIIL